MKWRKRSDSSSSGGLLFPFQGRTDIGPAPERASHDMLDERIAETHRQANHEGPKRFLRKTVRPSRLRFAGVLLLGVFGIFAWRSADLQIVQGAAYLSQAEGNRVRLQMVPSNRGVIYDRNRMVLADNTPVFRLVATPAYLPEAREEREQLVETVTGSLGVSIAEALSRLADGLDTPYEPVILSEDVPYEPALRMMVDMHPVDGMYIDIGTRRSYLTTAIPTLSHILGYTGRISPLEFETLAPDGYRRIDDLGKIGVEQVYETQLRGTFGRRAVEVDAVGNEVSIITKQDPIPGQNLVLSIDALLQAKIEQIIEEQLGTGVRASVVVVDPSTGELRALVSVPTYDSNVFTGGIDTKTYRALLEDPNRPLFARAVAGEFPSGSTFKTVVAAAGLAEGLITPSTSFASVGGIRIGQWYFPDWRAGGHGQTDVRKAIADSVNTFFYILGGGYEDFTGLGVERIMSYAALFGFGDQLGIDLTGEATGFLPSKRWKEEAKGERWYIGDTYHVAIGQGDFLATPLQIAMATTAFANGGTLYQPKVGYALDVAGETERIEPVVLDQQVLDPSVIQVVREGMRQAVTSGSARRLLSLEVTSAGKTGTAQWSSVGQPHGWFTSFAPYEAPELVVTVLVEEGGGGDQVALPIARDIYQWWFDQYELDPSVTEPLDGTETEPLE